MKLKIFIWVALAFFIVGIILALRVKAEEDLNLLRLGYIFLGGGFAALCFAQALRIFRKR